jgi:glutaredoxin
MEMVHPPQAPRIRLYTASVCAACEQARRLVVRHQVAFEEIDVGEPEVCCRLRELSGASVPQALLDGRPLGGYETLAALVRSGALDAAPTSDEKIRVAPTGGHCYHRAMSVEQQP